MLKTYIKTVPYTKFLLLIDSLENSGVELFDHVVKQHLTNSESNIHYCVFQGTIRKVQRKYELYTNVKLHDFVSKNNKEDLEKLVDSLKNKDIVIIDSISNAILLYGLPTTYRIFNSLKNNRTIIQIISVIHEDLIEGNSNTVTAFFTNLSTLQIHIQPKFLNNAKRVHYLYKKSGGKIISEHEEYTFEGDHLLSSKIVKPDPQKLVKTMQPEINPEDLSTFKIGLTDEEKASRDKVVLPYLPDAQAKLEEGQIFYKLDEMDDWDEEDPDDDLDI